MSKVEVQKGSKIVKVHPKLANVLVARGGYLRRDMAAQPVTATRVLNPAAEVDSEGQVWDPELHTAGKVKTQAGTWRKKPGASTQK